MKKTLLFLLILSLSVLCIAACGNESADSSTAPQSDSTSSPASSDGPPTSQSTASESLPTSTTTPATEAPTVQNTKWDGKTLKILAIGNSFSVDAMTYLYNIARAEGIENVILGNLYIGGCTLETHYNNMKSGAAAYQYYKNTRGAWVETPNATILDGILDEKWDIITMQQASGSSGQSATYTPYLEPMTAFVTEHMTNPDCQFAWHMTWAYQQNSTHSEFSKYRKDQTFMYRAICTVVQKYIVPSTAFPIVIPSGTAVQNARGSYFGDTLTRDGYHLNETARYIAGYTWFATLTGKTLSSLAYI